MNNAEQLLQTIQAMGSQLENLQAQLDEQRRATAQTQHELQRRDKDGVDLRSEVRACVVAHLQYQPLDAADRTKVLRGYPKIRKGPQPLTDENGLAGQLLQDHKHKKVITKDLPQQQRDDLEVLRVAALGWSAALSHADPAQALQQAVQALRDVTILVGDNAARKAKQQLQLTFEAVDAKGAYAVCDLDPDSEDCVLDNACHSIIQDVHVDAITRIKKLSNSCKRKTDKQKAKNDKGTRSNNNFRRDNKPYRSNNNYNGGRNNYNKRVTWSDQGSNNDNKTAKSG